MPTTFDELSVSTPSTTVAIWHNTSPAAYLGWQPSDEMIKVYTYRIAAVDALTPAAVVEEAFAIFNEGRDDPRAHAYWEAGNRSMCAGDVVVVADQAFSRDPGEWSPLNGVITSGTRQVRGSAPWEN